jgi:hypothetical protein
MINDAVRQRYSMISHTTFFRFVQLENFRRPGRPEYLAYRSRAAALLAYCAGLWFPEIMALTRRHWTPEGVQALLIESPDGIATRWTVGRFLRERPLLRTTIALCSIAMAACRVAPPKGGEVHSRKPSEINTKQLGCFDQGYHLV